MKLFKILYCSNFLLGKKKILLSLNFSGLTLDQFYIFKVFVIKILFLKTKNLKLCAYVCVRVGCDTWCSVFRSQKRALYPLEQELQEVLRWLWVLGIELGSSEGAASSLSCWATPQALLLFWNLHVYLGYSCPLSAGHRKAISSHCELAPQNTHTELCFHSTSVHQTDKSSTFLHSHWLR